MLDYFARRPFPNRKLRLALIYLYDELAGHIGGIYHMSVELEWSYQFPNFCSQDD